MDLALARVHLDITRLSALVDATGRVMTEEEAGTMTGYLRALGGIVRDRARPGKSRLGEKSWDELLEMARQIPELKDGLGE
jgi:hypothetical protein